MELSVVVPAYRQAATIGAELERLDRLVQQLADTYEIILVIDGDEDGTLEAVRQLRLPALRIECFAVNRGKGAALQHGMLAACGDKIAFIDAGGDIDPTYLELMLELQKFTDADIVIGSKRHPLSRVSYPPIRRFYSWAYQLLNQILFRLHVRDSQVGLKLFTRRVVEATVPYVSIHRFAFDLELLALSRARGFDAVIEAPVRIHHQFHSSINVWAALETVRDTLRIYWRLKRTPPHKLRVQPSPAVVFTHEQTASPLRSPRSSLVRHLR